MLGPVITLTCTNCGAPLTIHPDMEVIACGHSDWAAEQ
jgi:primosomal protein N'